MADRELRQSERDAAAGDPEAQARYLRQKCRTNDHTWIHHKGGPFHCKVCGAEAPGDPREWGARTQFIGIDRLPFLYPPPGQEPWSPPEA